MKIYTILFLVIITVLQGGCMKKEKKDPYKQGDLVTWKFNEELIIKTELGQRRIHIKDKDQRIENTFYRPHLEHYVGQFPIDYQPKKYATLSKQEAQQIEPYKRDVDNWLEFDLMLNGSWVEPTDISIHSPKALDHEDQVKVRVNVAHKEDLISNTKDFFDYRFENYLDKNSKQEYYNMSCFNLLSGHGKECFGISSNQNISGYKVLIFDNSNISVDYHNEPYYGGVSIRYVVNPKNFDKIPNIDQAIWRMLNAWNVSPN